MRTVAIVGGETHIGEITALNGKELKIVGAAVREEQIEQARDSFKTDIYTDFRKLLTEKNPDLVAVANENHKKAEVVLESLRRGCHVIADKPIVIRLSELEEIEHHATKYGSRILMLLTLRGHGQYRKVKEIVDSGVIGEPIQCQAKMSVELKKDKRPPWFLDQRYAGGPILDLSIHSIDAVEWTTGLKLTDVTSYQANLTHPEMPHLIDSGVSLFGLENGGTAFIQQNRVLPDGCGNDYRLDIVGTKGQIEFRLNKYLRVQTKDNEVVEYDRESMSENKSVVADWLKSLDDESYSPMIPDSESLRANRIACLAQQSADEGKTISIHA